MKFLKLFSLFLATTFIFFACRKQDCDCDNQQRTDELSNTSWKGAYGYIFNGGAKVDTTFVLAFDKRGAINVYLSMDTAKTGIQGKGTYSFDGTTFNSTITLYKVGSLYILKGTKTNDGQILGTLNYGEGNNKEGIFSLSPWSH